MQSLVSIILNGIVILVLLPVISWGINKGINMLIKKLDQLIDEVKKLNLTDKEHEADIKRLKEKSKEHTEQLKEHELQIKQIHEVQLKCKANG